MLELRQKIKITKPYKGKTKFEFWTNIQVGDIIEIQLPISDITSMGYVPRLKFRNITQNKYKSNISLTESSKYLKHFEYEIIN